MSALLRPVLRRSALLASPAIIRSTSRSVTTLGKVLYTAESKSTGGRNGKAVSNNGALSVDLAMPKELGGSGKGANPEQLFGMGYSACFIGAMGLVSKTKFNKALPADTSATALVHIGPPSGKTEGFALGVDLKVKVPGWEKAEVEKLLKAAHEVCPYSLATKGNVEVKLTAL
ncbi:OsmC-like protein [Phlyctochytrium arcticum]|nr:OsmC-like protein [Phlyctochytrium arcticum]